MIEQEADMVVLAVGLEANNDAAKIAEMVGIIAYVLLILIAFKPLTVHADLIVILSDGVFGNEANGFLVELKIILFR